MSDRLPPLTALRAFDAAARHMSFQKAAAELNVTPAALSFQIKSLEDHLGQKLFHRLNRAVALTEIGHALAPGTRDGFEALGAAWRATRRISEQSTLTVTAGPAFTTIWLAPRLYSFAQAHPEIELRLSAGIGLVDLTHSEVDLAIRFGQGPDGPDLHVQPLMDDWATPMMTPELAKSYPGLDGIRRMPIVHPENIDYLDRTIDWPTWFRAAGLPPRDWSGPRFSQADHGINAALSGTGAIMGRISHTSHLLNEGRLVAPYRIGLRTRAQYRILCLKGRETHPQISAFINWMVDQVSGVTLFDGNFDLVDPEMVASL